MYTIQQTISYRIIYAHSIYIMYQQVLANLVNCAKGFSDLWNHKYHLLLLDHSPNFSPPNSLKFINVLSRQCFPLYHMAPNIREIIFS